HDGLRLFSRVYSGPAADAPVVLCLHGLMRNSRDFGDLATHLAARYRVIAPDIRGRGFSDRDRNFNNYRIPVYLEDVGTLLAGLLEVDAEPLISEPLKDWKAVAPDLWPLWKSLGAPILAIRGATSDILSVSTLERMKREKPDLRTLTAANRGHTPLLDEPECLAAIDEFLAAGA